MAKNKDKDKTSNNSPDIQEEEHSAKSDSLEEENKVLSELVKSLEEKTLRAQAEIENIRKIITSASKIFDKYSDVKSAIKGALESYRAHGNKLQTIVTKSWGTQGLEKQIKKLEDEHGVIPGKQIPEIPPEQATITDVSDPEEDKDKLN